MQMNGSVSLFPERLSPYARMPTSEEADSQNGVAQPSRSESLTGMSEGMTLRRLPTNTSARNPTYPMGHPVRRASPNTRRRWFSPRSLGLRDVGRSRRRLIHLRARRRPGRSPVNPQARKAASIGALTFVYPLGPGTSIFAARRPSTKNLAKNRCTQTVQFSVFLKPPVAQALLRFTPHSFHSFFHNRSFPGSTAFDPTLAASQCLGDTTENEGAFPQVFHGLGTPARRRRRPRARQATLDQLRGLGCGQSGRRLASPTSMT